MIEAGFAKVDITPRVGVELCGFGPYLNRHSVGVRDRLWARAMALRRGRRTAVMVSCDLVGVGLATTRRVRALLRERAGVPEDAVMVHCTHTHSGPTTIDLIGWGDPDDPYNELLPRRIAQAATDALANLSPAEFLHAEVPCEGIGLNREYDRDAPPLEEVLDEDWRPARPELTDTTCHVIRVDKDGRVAGFLSYFGCHPVVCCAATRHIHGDYPGVATNALEREYPGSVGLFLQGAQGDVNSCVVHKPEQESLPALDVVAARYARSVREGLRAARAAEVNDLRFARREVTFRRRQISLQQLREKLAQQESVLARQGATDADREVRMATVQLAALRRLIARAEAGGPLEPPSEVQGIALGPIAFLGSPFEIFQAIKNEVAAGCRAPVPLVMGLTNDFLGYAPDRTAAERGGYAADTVPMMLGALPFASIHEELARALLDLDAALCDAREGAANHG